VTDEDMLHALTHPLYESQRDDRWLVLGADRAGNVVELVVIITEQGDERIIHAMRATKENLKNL
jgi:hypothetical protein